MSTVTLHNLRVEGGLLDGVTAGTAAQTYSAHLARLGPTPPPTPSFLDELERSGLRGRGGAGFPAATKWRAVAARSAGRAVVLVNGAEGEPLSRKDSLLMSSRPHLVLDGALLAAQTVAAKRVVVYVGAAHRAALAALVTAVDERGDTAGVAIELVTAPDRYVAGEETAAVHCIDGGPALPTSGSSRPFERGVSGRPTLVNNVETLAQAAMIARRGATWFRDLGRGACSGSTLLTVNGREVVEVACGTTMRELLGAPDRNRCQAVLVGGYFGQWVADDDAAGLAIDAGAMRRSGHSLGCGVVAQLPGDRCGVRETARIASWLAAQSARQCGPCVFGLRAVAACLERVAEGSAAPGDWQRLQRWSGELAGRGACRHPDGAATLVRSALSVFAAEYETHIAANVCSAAPLQRQAA